MVKRLLFRALGYVYRNVTILNISILAMIVLMILFAVLPLVRLKVKVGLPVVKPKAAAKEEAVQEKAPAPSAMDYVMIGENNLFHPERRIPPEKQEEKALPKPELVLYGTIIGDSMSVAYVEDKKAPKTTQGRGNRQQTMKKGDVTGGFVLKEIDPDKIVLARGEETMVVYLSDDTKHRGGGDSGPGRPAGAGPQPGVRGAPGQGATVAPRPADAAPQRVLPRNWRGVQAPQPDNAPVPPTPPAPPKPAK